MNDEWIGKICEGIIKYMSATHGTIETSSNIFNNTFSKDFVLRTNDVSEKLVIGNTMCNTDNAALYVTKNAIGIRQVPGTNSILDAPGFHIDSGCNVTVDNLLSTNTIFAAGDIIPQQDVTYNLGSPSLRFKDLYLSGQTVHVGDTSISRNSNGDITFVDKSSNLRNVICGQVNVNGTLISKDANGKIVIGNTPISLLDHIEYNATNNYTGFGTSNPLSTLHAHNALVASEMRLMFTDQRTGGACNTQGFQLWKDALGNGYVQNYLAGKDISISAAANGNVNIGNNTGTGQVMIYSSNNAQATFITSTASNTSGIILDAASAGYGVVTGNNTQGARKYYIRSTGSLATSAGGAANDRGGLLEIGDMGGAYSNDGSGRSNLVVLDRFSRLWVGRDIVPGKLGTPFVGTNGSNDSQPAIVIVGDSNSSGIKMPLLHLARNARSNDLNGFSFQLKDQSGSNSIAIGRNNASSNNGNPTASNDITINATGNVGIGDISSVSDKFRVTANEGQSSNAGIVSTNSNSYITLQSKSAAGSLNPLVAADDARIIFSSNSTQGAGALVIGPWSSNRKGMRLSATSAHEIAGDTYMNGKFGVGTSNPTYNVEVIGSLRATSNADLSNVTTCNLATQNIVASTNILNIGCDSGTSTVNMACSTISQVVNIGTGGTSNTVINIGGPGDVVNIIGTTNTVTATTTTTSNKTIDMNSGGASGTGGGAGLNIIEAGSSAGYIKTSPDRSGWLLKAPATPEAKIDLTGGNITMGGLNMNTNSNVGIGTTSPQYKLDVNGAVNASSYCNLQWSMIKNIPGLSTFTNDLSNFSSLNVTGTTTSSNLVVSGTSTLSNVTVTNVNASTASISNLMATGALTTSTIVAADGTLAIACASNTTRVDIGTNSNTSLLNIGTCDSGAVINIGGSKDIINITGTLLATLSVHDSQPDGSFTYNDYYIGADPNYHSDYDTLVVPSLSVGTGISPLGPTSAISDKFRVGLFSDPSKISLLNRDSIENSGGNVGFEIEENGVIAGWFETFSNRMGYSMKAPGATQSLEIAMGDNFVSFNSNSLMVVGASNGIVGIGTSSPNTNYKLHVAGPLYANSYVNLPIGDAFGNSGMVSLCNAINSTSQISAASALAVKTAYDAAISACNIASGRWVQSNATDVVNGTVKLCDATNSNLTTGNSFAATPKAVMDTYNFAATKWSSNMASGTAQGIVYLTDSTSCNISATTQPIAASAKGLYTVNQLVAAKWSAVFASNISPGYSYISDATNCNRSWSNVDALYTGPIAASVKAVFDTMQVASAASNKAYTTTLATGSIVGGVYLTDGTACNNLVASSNFAASPYAVAQAYSLATAASNFAGTKWSNLNASGVVQGTVMLSDSTSNASSQSNATPYAASPAAVKTVMDKLTTTSNQAYSCWQPVNASTTVKGYVCITDATNCNAGTANSIPVVPSALALSNVLALATTASNQAYAIPATAASATKGQVMLSDSYTDSTNGVNNGIAATPKAVQGVYTFASGKFTDQPGQASQRGTVYLTDSTSCNVSQVSASIAASAKAVYDAYQMAVAASNWASARPNNIGSGSTTVAGAVQLCDDQTNTSTTLAATINAVSKVNALVTGGLQKTGGTMTGDLNVTNVVGSGDLKTSGKVWAGNGGNFMQLWSDSALVGKNTADMKFGFAADTAATAWSEKMRITTTGNVGIGQSAATFKLDVLGVTSVARFQGDVSVDPTLNDPSLDTYSQFSISTSSNVTGSNFKCIMRTGVYNIGNYGYIQMTNPYVGNPALALQPYAGSVGIGTTKPLSKLHVYGSALSGVTPAFTIDGSFGKGTYINLGGAGRTLGVMNGGNLYMGFNMLYDATTGTFKTDASQTLGTGGFIMDTFGNINLVTNASAAGGASITPTAKLIVSNAGNVGIGTTSPSEKLHVSNGNAYLDNGWMKFPQNTTGVQWGAASSKIYDNGSMHIYGGNTIYFDTAAGSAMNISTVGFVGIGTAGAAGAQLEVSGEVRTSGGGGGFAMVDRTTSQKMIMYCSSDYFYLADYGVAPRLVVRRTTGYTGINTTAPKKALHVSSTAASTSAELCVTNSDLSCYINLYSGNSGDANPAIICNSGKTMRFGTYTTLEPASGWFETGRISSVGNWYTTGNIQVSGAGIYNSSGKNIIQTNSTDWLRINQDLGFTNGTALYGKLNVNGGGGLGVGHWNDVAAGDGSFTGALYAQALLNLTPWNFNHSCGLSWNCANSASGTTAMLMYADYATNTSSGWYFRYGTGTDATNGALRAMIRWDGLYQNLSDARMKNVTGLIENPLEKLSGINGVYYTWKEETSNPQMNIGVLAQDVEKVLPEAVSTQIDGHKTVAYSSLTPLLIEAVKELNTTVVAQQARIGQLEQDVAELKALVKSLVAAQ